MASIELREYTKRGLRELLADERFWSQPQLPITRRRVVSQGSNPRAEDDDTVLVTAFKKGRLVAYLGILPDLVQNEAGKPTKFGWLTAWWVDKESESRLAATMVLFAAMKRYAYRVAASSPSNDAVRVYDATGRFHECATFARSYFVMALPPSFLLLSASSRWIVGSANRMMASRTLQGRGLEVRTVDSLGDDLASFIDRLTAGDPLSRNATYWRWILEYPWMSASAEDEAAQRSYAFSLFAEDFRQIPMCVTRRCAVIAFLVATLRDGRLTLKYALYDETDIADVAAALQVAIGEVKPWLFVCADISLGSALREAPLFHLMKQIKSSSVYSTKVLSLSAGPRLQFGIGDTIFT
jgi:hypothetical protein